MSTIGERIREQRLLLGISQQELADALGVHKATISRYEDNSVRNIKPPVLEAIAKCLRTDVNYLEHGCSSQYSTREPSYIQLAIELRALDATVEDIKLALNLIKMIKNNDTDNIN